MTLVAAAAVTVLAGDATQSGKGFEVVSIRPLDSRVQVRSSSRLAGVQFQFSSVTPRELVMRAFALEELARVIAPEWTTQERYDVRAVVAAGTSDRDIPEMLKALLMERFKLKMHVEKRLYPVYELSVLPTGPKLTEVPPNNDLQTVFPNDSTVVSDRLTGLPGDERRTINRMGGVRRISDRTSYEVKVLPGGASELDATRITMAEFIREIRLTVDRPVVDKTSLNAIYQFKTLLPPPSPSPAMQAILSGRGNADPSGVSLARSLENLGLNLEPGNSPADFIVIDRIERPSPD